MNLLDTVPIFNLLCVPAETDAATIQQLQAYRVTKRAFYIVDCPQVASTTNLPANGPFGTTGGTLCIVSIDWNGSSRSAAMRDSCNCG